MKIWRLRKPAGPSHAEITAATNALSADDTLEVTACCDCGVVLATSSAKVVVDDGCRKAYCRTCAPPWDECHCDYTASCQPPRYYRRVEVDETGQPVGYQRIVQPTPRQDG